MLRSSIQHPTFIIGLLLQEDCLEFLEEERLKGLIKRYSEFINFPIYLFTSKEEVHLFPANALPLGIGRSSHAIVDHV